MIKHKLIIIFIVLLSTSRAYGGELSTLIAIGESQESMQKALDKETKVYNSIKRALEKGKIKKGDSGDKIRKRYGEPVVILADKNYAEKWVYKPGYADWFNGVKIYLFFNDEKELAGIRMMTVSSK